MDILSTHNQILIRDLSRVLDDGSPSQESAEALIIKAERVHHQMVTLVDVVPGIESNLPLIESIISSLNNFLLTTGSHSEHHNYGYSAPWFISMGRPKVVIPRDMLEYLIGNHFSVHRVLNCFKHLWALWDVECMNLELVLEAPIVLMIDTIVREIHQYPNCGYRSLKGGHHTWQQ